MCISGSLRISKKAISRKSCKALRLLRLWLEESRKAKERKKVEKFRELKVWQKAHELVMKVYRVTQDFPVEEKYGLVSQMKRAAISVPANIAEGTKRKSRKDRLHFHVMAEASLEELKYYFILCSDLHLANGNNFDDLFELAREVGRMLSSLNKTLEMST